MPLRGVGLHKAVGRRSRRIRYVAGIDEDADHDRDFLLRDQVVDHVERGIVAIAMDIPAAVLKDHEGRGNFRVVAGGHVYPVLALHAVVDFAGVYELFRQLAGRHAGLEIRVRAECGKIQTSAEFGSRDLVVKGVQGAQLFDSGHRIP